MSTPGRPSRVFGNGPDDTIPSSADRRGSLRGSLRGLGRLSFGGLHHRPSFVSRWRGNVQSGDMEQQQGSTPAGEQPPIPTMIQPAGEAYTTPLPVISMIVLSITMLGEFLSANVSMPFLLFMVKGFGQTTDEAEIAFLTGVLVSTFFLTQFLTSLLWATVAEKHGRRIVLTVSLLGSAVTCFAFGTCTSFQEAVCVRLLQGVFAGSIGVARGSIAFVTDASNEGRAYAILGFCWGFGGGAGAIIGGLTESPADKWPAVFGSVPFLVKYPYVFPCAIAASITFFGSILSLFLGRDGGPREGAIQLPPEKITSHSPIPEEDSVPPSPILEDMEQQGKFGSLRKKLTQKVSGYFSQNGVDSPQASATAPVAMNRRTFSRTSRANGSAYGYGASSYRNRIASVNTRRGSVSSAGLRNRRRGSNVDDMRQASFSNTSEMNFAQRLLMANENAVTNMGDLWVAAAMNVDNEDPFESDTEVADDDDESVLDLGEELSSGEEDAGESALVEDTPTRRGRRGTSNALVPLDSPTRRFSASQRRQSNASPAPHRPSFLGSPRRPSAPLQIPGHRHGSLSLSPGGEMVGTPTSMGRRVSGAVPAIFSHAGVRTPPAVLDAQQLLLRSSDSEAGAGAERQQPSDNLAPILESRRQSRAEASLAATTADVEAGQLQKPPSLTSVLPILVILQYGLLALHQTTHDQIFMSYLVSDYEAGGLNLNAGHFAQLTALMCLAQILYQFYIYPNVGPPRGRFSHLAMFRIGSLLFVPAYLTVTLYRVPFASANDDGNFVLMAALAFSSALRFCGSTFGYTAISILLNYMTPPEAVGFANGIAQSIVSLARFMGPILGGTLWSVSVEGNPSGYPLGFFCCAGFCLLSVAQSFMIR